MGFAQELSSAELADLQINTKDLKAKADKVNLSPPMSPMTMRRGSPDLSPLNSVSPQAHPTQSISDGVDKVLMARTAIEHIEILLPQHTQHHGTAFGGQIMQWMAETGFISAHRVITDTPVLKSVDDVHFINPGHLGERIHIFCQVNRSFNQSCEVGVRIEAFPIGEKPRHINSAFLTFVSKGSLPARSVIVTNEMEERRYLDAASRRKVAIDRAVLRSKERNLTVPFDTNTRADIIASNVRGLMHLVQSKSGWEKGVSSETETWNVYMKQQAGRTCIKAQGTLPHPASQMFETVRAMPLRPLWDPIYSESIVVEILDEFNYICLQRLKETKSTPAQELLVLVSVRQLGEVGGNYVFAFRSIDHADYPVQKDTIRAEIYSGGFVVQPIDAESCQFWYLQNGMTDSIMQYIAADFIGFSNTIGYTMNCLVNFQERLYVQKEWQVVHDMAKEVLKERLKLVEVYSHMENRTPDQELELTYRRASMTTMVMAMVRLRDMEARSQPLDTKRKLTDSLLAPLSPRSESTLRLARKSVGRIQTLFRKDSRKGSVPDAKHE
ncbi:hypothetical protein SARC_07989 [Sphaeroforma arctica JP610]|uniref:START domain-containing protein n=1 Tax=Sphaeroforma arctica JP610 TaxID=667725 RepID=A0A0L0FS51_9EUKA|nr:hypothetical protein SARC_07989 [Sphaeroforma arctica JP610]KNC79617.1 hypothetical protein SARC_07989 [Sphaeroforma arctica JP610]|eukprot:XP_014153519.1 hypothetical protein SARC_07989 [Sphaeroforma arctica JP610]